MTSTDPATPGDALMGRVIYLVGAIAILALAGVIILATRGQTIPDVLQNIAVGAITGLTALLAGRRGS